MKIGIDAHEIEKRPTGVGRVLLSLLNEWNNFVLDKTEFILYFKEEIPDLNLSERFEKKLLNSKSNALFVHYHLPKAAKKDKVDLLFCPGYVAPVFYKGKIALSLHDIIYEARPSEYNWPSIFDKFLLKKISKISAKKARIILTCSRFSKTEIIKHYRTDPEKIRVIYLAADKSFCPIGKEEVKKIKEKYGIRNKFILYLGSIFDRRHLPEIIEAFKRVKIDDCQLLIVGQNYTSFNIEKETDQRIIKRDYLEEKDLPLIYSAADLFIYLSDYEGFGLPVLEAMSCETPVITSKKASLPEVAGDSVIYVENNGDIDEIGNSIKAGLIDYKLRNELIRKGLEQSSKFSWERCAKETLDALISIE